MKCGKCGNEYSNERFCPVCGYPSDDLQASRREQAERYAADTGHRNE